MQTTAIWYFGALIDHRFVPGGTWSLVIEEYFYLIAPALLWASYRFSRGNLWSLTAVIAGVAASGFFVRLVLNAHYAPDDPNWYFASFVQFRSRYDELAFGVLAALIVRAVAMDSKARLAAVAAGAALIAGVVIAIYNSRMWAFAGQTTRMGALWFPTLCGLGFALIVLGVREWPVRSRPIIIVARLSFALYLGHIFVHEILLAYPASAASRTIADLGLAGAAAKMIISLIFAWLMSLLVEYPFLRLYRAPAAGAHDARGAGPDRGAMPAAPVHATLDAPSNR